jgi:hypothetical protein
MSRISEDSSETGSVASRRMGGSPEGKLTMNKLEKHNQAFTSSGMSTGRRSIRSEAMSTASNISGMHVFCLSFACI